MQPPIVLTSEVATAIHEHLPILALETAVLRFGLPHPLNLQTMISLDTYCREMGVIPAPVAVLDGVVRIGLTGEEMERLATAPNAIKVTTRLLPYAVTSGLPGATTVASTMFIAAFKGIRTFATGGIGGVHRFAEQTFDISADLMEFTRSPVMVVSAGIKVILDIPRTMELMETMGIPVYGFRTTDLPGFYCSATGIRIPSLPDVAAIIRTYQTQRSFGLMNGMLITRPVPEEFSMDRAKLESLIDKALSEAAENGVTGAAVTPWLLDALARSTGYDSVKTNQSLLTNNVDLGCRIATHLSRTV